MPSVGKVYGLLESTETPEGAAVTFVNPLRVLALVELEDERLLDIEDAAEED